jgi:hypothetical protein
MRQARTFEQGNDFAQESDPVAARSQVLGDDLDRQLGHGTPVLLLRGQKRAMSM